MALASSSEKRMGVSPGAEQRNSLDEDDDYEPYIPVAQRRQIQLARIANRGLAKTLSTKQKSLRDGGREWEEEREGEEEEGEQLKEKLRKERTLLEEAQEVHRKKKIEGMFHNITGSSLFDLARDAIFQTLRRLIFRRQRRPMRRYYLLSRTRGS